MTRVVIFPKLTERAARTIANDFFCFKARFMSGPVLMRDFDTHNEVVRFEITETQGIALIASLLAVVFGCTVFCLYQCWRSSQKFPLKQAGPTPDPAAVEDKVDPITSLKGSPQKPHLDRKHTAVTRAPPGSPDWDRDAQSTDGWASPHVQQQKQQAQEDGDELSDVGASSTEVTPQRSRATISRLGGEAAASPSPDTFRTLARTTQSPLQVTIHKEKNEAQGRQQQQQGSQRGNASSRKEQNKQGSKQWSAKKTTSSSRQKNRPTTRGPNRLPSSQKGRQEIDV